MTELANYGDFIKNSPTEKSSMEIPAMLKQSFFGYIELLENSFPDSVNKTSFNEMVAALLFNLLMANPEENMRVLKQYRKERVSQIPIYTLSEQRPRFGRPKKPLLDNT